MIWDTFCWSDTIVQIDSGDFFIYRGISRTKPPGVGRSSGRIYAMVAESQTHRVTRHVA